MKAGGRARSVLQRGFGSALPSPDSSLREESVLSQGEREGKSAAGEEGGEEVEEVLGVGDVVVVEVGAKDEKVLEELEEVGAVEDAVVVPVGHADGGVLDA